MRLLIAGGGTGGHIFPALAVARSLRDRPAAPELIWLGGYRGFERSLVPPSGIRLRRLALRSLRSAGRDIHLLLDPLRLAVAVPQATAIIARLRPAAIFTTGGFVAIPTLLAAAPLRIPVVLWDGNVRPGRSVRVTAPLADVLAVSFTSTCAALVGAGKPCYVTGTPIRDVGGIDRERARELLDLPVDARVVFVFGGSQPVRRLNAAVAGALPRLVERFHVVHVTGDYGYAEAVANQAQLPPDVRDRYRPYRFLGEEMLAALAAADLVVGRAGSSTLAEVSALGVPMVVVPYPHAAGHQRANAEALVAAGAARLVEDEAFDSAALIEATALIDNAATRDRMAAAARSLSRPGAAEAVAELVMATAERRALPDPAAIDRLCRRATA